ncbi:hypothetical protein BDV19DRAFT_375284 [Aspergillus venezuelensis]
MMLLTSLLALALTLLPSTTAQGVTINAPCRGSGYQCIQGNHAIASCDGRQWKLAAECGNMCCAFVAGAQAPNCVRC